MARRDRYQRQDRFYKKAKTDQFVARSVYKLDELDRRHRLVQRGDVVVDLGCAPGSWLQYLSERVGRKGAVVGYDLVPVDLALPRVVTRVASIEALDPDTVQADLRTVLVDAPQHRPVPVDAIVSDMAPKLTGIRDADQARSVELVRIALALCRPLLTAEKGTFVAKLFQGRDTDELVADVKVVFRDVKLLKPEATREGSREVFVLGRRMRPSGPD